MNSNSMLFPLPDSLDLKHTLECGQCFGWREKKGGYWNVLKEKIFFLYPLKNSMEVFVYPRARNWKSILVRYFRLDEKIKKVHGLLRKETWGKEALSFSPGLRLVRQDPWETVASFLCSSVSNIPRIQKSLFLLRRHFGKKISWEKKNFFAFPTPGEIVEKGEKKLALCKLGFRADYLYQTANILFQKKKILSSLKKKNSEESKKILKGFPGIGDKIANCILLGAFDKTEAFPVDVWIQRAMEKAYPSLEGARPEKIQEWALKKWGSLAGYMQLYLFHYARNFFWKGKL